MIGPDDIEFSTCLCGVTFRWTDEAQAALHRPHRRPRWVALRKGIFMHPPQWGPWHLLTGARLATAACGANLYRRSRYDTRVVTERPTERLCRKCARLPERPWEETDA